MNAPDLELDRHLQALFADLDTGADFDARLMARLRAESKADASERAMRARQQERARHRQAVLALQSWRRSMLRLLTLDTLGIAFMLVVAAVTAWPHISRVMDSSRQYWPYIAMLSVILMGAVPLVGMWAEQSRRPVQLP